MSYRRLLKLAPQQNSIVNKCLRAAWAKQYLYLIKNGRTRIINIDESTFGQYDFHRMMWAPKHGSRGAVIKSVTPRISLIMALDNNGYVYACLTQVITDSTIMAMYLKTLVRILDAENKHWRKHTIILHDGSRYCQSEIMLKTIKQLRLPFMLSGPHSYNTAPVEMLFGGIKTGNLNVDNLPTGRG